MSRDRLEFLPISQIIFCTIRQDPTFPPEYEGGPNIRNSDVTVAVKQLKNNKTHGQLKISDMAVI